MARLISSDSSSISLIFIILLSVDLFGASLRATAITPLIKTACDLCNVKDFCYNVLAENREANRAITRFNLEDVAIQLAYTNYTNIHRKVLTITTNETNPTLKKMYKQCLHQYVLMKKDFEFLLETLVMKGDMGQAIIVAQDDLFVCMSLFTQSPASPNPFAQDNDNMASFLELIRDISFYLL
ncbi:uncharacterized protein LOC132057933 [Lycium ferocissimum]|uniref:uncharacterized protein LOC132057933 n=1 Tax=Lycium ferocissimum TaxID=112874 RepID=UPI0028149C6A|nr:uncharacterized protein LOC132057933 [Lycium ferocissimum]